MHNFGDQIIIANNTSLEKLDSKIERLDNLNGISILMLIAKLILRLVARKEIAVVIKSRVS